MKKIKQEFNKIFRNLYTNKFEYLLNISIMEALILFFGTVCLELIFKLMIYFAGINNITQSNFLNIFYSPLSIISLIVYVIVMAFFIFFEFSFIVFMVYGKFNNKNYSIKTIFSKTCNSIKELFGKQLIFFMLYFITMIPVQNLGFTSVLTKDLYIPKFITGELTKSTANLILFLIAVIILIYINFRLFFVIPLTIISRKKLSESIKQSWEITKNSKLEIVIIIFSFEVIFFIISTILFLLTYLIFTKLDSNGNSLLLQTIFYTIIQSIIFFFNVMSKLVIISTLISIIVDKKEVSSDIVSLNGSEKRKIKYFNVLIILLTTVLLIYNGINIYVMGVNLDILTIAHRGDVSGGVENSIEALEMAAKNKADYVEMDIVMTSDNKFVVLHDFNLKRLAGINKNIYNMSFDEIVGLKVKQSGFISFIPSFEEYVKKAKELNIKLLVELKPHGHEPENYVDLVINELKRLGIDREYKVMSLNKDIMEKINEKEPEIETGYVIPIQFGSFSKTNVDFYVIEDFSFSDYLVTEAKFDKKEVFVWTINDDKDMKKYLQTSIDAIITDHPGMLNKMKKNFENNNTYLDKVKRNFGL